MKVKLTPDDIRKIESAFEKRGTATVELKREQGQITVLRVSKEKIEIEKTQ